VSADTVLWLINEAGPAFASKNQFGNGTDNSRSGRAWFLGNQAHRQGHNFKQFCDAVREDPQDGGWYHKKGTANNFRELKRIWVKVTGAAAQVADTEIPPQFSDDALALQFSRAYAEQLRYVAVWGGWLIWTGQHWRREETLKAFDLARALCRRISAQLTNPKSAKAATAISSATTIAAVERLAKADRRHAMTPTDWDADDWLINPPPPKEPHADDN
jgi:hypothetical protein